MNRIRIVFAILAVVMFVPLGILVEGAFQSVQRERAERHAAVAERVFDEMERELKRIVQREEARHFSHYRFFFVPEADSLGRYVVARSPLSEFSREPFVLGYFQIDPDRSVHNPLIPRDLELGRALSEWSLTIEMERSVRLVQRIVQLGLQEVRQGIEPKPAIQQASEGSHLSDDPIFSALPGTTHQMPFPNGGVLGFQQPATEQAQRRSAEAASSENSSGTFDALRSLNRAGQPRSVAIRVSRGRNGATIEFRDLASVHRTALSLTEDGIPRSNASARSGPDLDRELVLSRHFDIDEALRNRHPGVVPVGLHRLEGKRVGGDHLLLYREAVMGGQLFRQGLALDFRALTRWLDESVLGGSEVGENAARDFFMRDASPHRRQFSAAYVYAHRFSEPFDDLAMRLMLPPMSDPGRTNYLYIVVVLLVVVGAVGLFALYHMVGVTVRYADRRSNFASAVTHELKTPLTAIRMHGEMLREGMVGEERRAEYYETITSESERLTRLIDNVLEFSRIEQGTREMALQRGDIGPVILDAVRTLEGTVRAADFELEIQVEEGLPHVRHERDALVQVVYNLIDNALKYSAGEETSKRICVGCSRTGEVVKLSVRDEGPGVDPRHLRKIFEPFYRGENEMTRTEKGTGIGLALVKGLADRMGAVAVGRNVEGGGFEVTLSFRVERSDAAASNGGEPLA